MSSISSFYHRRANVNTSSRPVLPQVVPFRNAAGEIQYTSAPALPSWNYRSSSEQDQYSVHNADNCDSEGEPLLRATVRSHNYNELTEEEKARFTATGGPMRPQYAINSLQNLRADIYSTAQFVPKQYTDDTIVPAIVVNVTPSPKPASEDKRKRGKSFTSMFKGEKSGKEASKKITKIVFMPRGEYLKQFAKDDKGNYVGTVPQREWTEDQLEEVYGQYKPPPNRQRGLHGSWNSMTIAQARAG